jgi:ribosome-binding protein aMBF1 (putative translation factor)
MSRRRKRDQLPGVRVELGGRSPDRLDIQIGECIRIRRRQIGMSQKDLAEKLGLRRQQV